MRMKKISRTTTERKRERQAVAAALVKKAVSDLKSSTEQARELGLGVDFCFHDRDVDTKFGAVDGDSVTVTVTVTREEEL